MTAPCVDWPAILRLGQTASMPANARLEVVRRLLWQRYDEPWSVPDLARRASMSREAFIRAFRAAYGETPHQYLLARRIDAARDLLRAGEGTVTDVCFAVGFSSLGSFSTTFHRRVGAPPSRFRRRLVAVPDSLGAAAWIPGCFLHRVGGVPRP